MADPFDWSAAYGLESYVAPMVSQWYQPGPAYLNQASVQDILSGAAPYPTRPPISPPQGPPTTAQSRYRQIQSAGQLVSGHAGSMASFGTSYMAELERGPLQYATAEEKAGVFETAIGEARSVAEPLVQQFGVFDVFGLPGFTTGQQDVLRAALDIEAGKVEQEILFRYGGNPPPEPGTPAPPVNGGGTVARTLLGG